MPKGQKPYPKGTMKREDFKEPMKPKKRDKAEPDMDDLTPRSNLPRYAGSRPTKARGR